MSRNRQMPRYRLAAAGLAIVLAAGLAVLAGRRPGDLHPRLIQVRTTPSAGRIGDPIRVAARVALPRNWHLAGQTQWRLPANMILHSHGRRRSGLGWRTAAWNLWFVLQAHDLGRYPAISARVPLADDAGRTASLELTVPPIDIHPRFADEDPGQLQMAAETLAEGRAGKRPPWTRPLPLGGAALLLAAAAGLATRWRRRRRRGPPSTPQATAAAELAALEQRLPLPPPHFFEALAHILRRYLAARCRLPAEELTTAELAAELQRQPTVFSDQQKAGLAEALRRTDKGRFSGAEVPQQDMAGALAKARELVLETAAAANGSADAHV